MKVRFNPETQDCEMLVGDQWAPLTASKGPGDYCIFEVPARVVSPKAYELTTADAAGDERSLHATEAEALDAAVAYVRRELAPLVDDDGTPLLDKFNLAVERDGIEDALSDANDQYGPEISYSIEEIHVPTKTPTGVPTFGQLVKWCEQFDGDSTEGWLLRVLSGEITIDNFNRAVLTRTAPEGV